MKCKNCGKVYEVEESTLFINEKNYDKCPLCHSEGKEISQTSMIDIMNEQSEKFNKRKRR